MHKLYQPLFLFVALSTITCSHDVKPANPASLTEAPTKKEQAPPCRTDEDCLQVGNSALTMGDAEKGRAALEYGCAASPAGGSCNRLGGVYLYAPPADPAREREVLEYSCVDGAFDVCARLAIMYSKGQGGEANPAKALSAAEFGCSELGDAKRAGLRGEACYLLGDNTKAADRESAKGFFSVGCTLSYAPNCEALTMIKGQEEAEVRAAEAKAEAEAKTRAAEAEAAKKAAGPLPGANLNIGSLTSDGLEMKDIACKVNGRIGLLGSLVVVAGLGERKKKMDACHKGSTETTIHFWQSGGKISKVEAMSEDKKLNQCLEKAVTGAPSTMEAECFATVTHGK